MEENYSCRGMMMRRSRVTLARETDAAALASLHSAALLVMFLSRLGHRFLKLFFSAFSEHDGDVCLVTNDAESLVGFVAGTTRSQGFFSNCF